MFWTVILSGVAAGCAYLQYLGPPPPGFYDTGVPVKAGPPAVAPQKPAPQQAAAAAPIAGPDPKLLAASAADAQWQVPKIAADGATPMQAYAASQPPPGAAMLAPDVPRVAVVIAGLGDDARLDGLAAGLKSPISFALSPYGKDLTQAAAAARDSGHEMLLMLPMPGLLAGAPKRQNENTLDWSMAQFQGYAGATDAFGPAMGGGFMMNAQAKSWLMSNIARRGLFYIEGDPAASALLYAAGRRADIVIDAPAGTGLEAHELAALVAAAQARHTALAVMIDPTPAALKTLAAWSATLVKQDVLLVPVSALVLPPDVPAPMYASTKP